MDSTKKKSSIVVVLTFLFTFGISAQNNSSNIDFNALSEEFLSCIKKKEDTQHFQDTLAKTTIETLQSNLHTNNQRLAFWVNIYNAYIQIILTENPEAYKDKNVFFKKKQILIAREYISFAKIEHGILRKSQWELGFGYFRKWFPSRLERKLRVDKQDFRIHFALNCGAKDCPPVAIYNVDDLDAQFNKGTEQFLRETSDYNKNKKEVFITPLFNWFRGDFGSKRGIRKILKQFNIVPENVTKVTITYKNYDWTLDLNNWTNL